MESATLQRSVCSGNGWKVQHYSALFAVEIILNHRSFFTVMLFEIVDSDSCLSASAFEAKDVLSDGDFANTCLEKKMLEECSLNLSVVPRAFAFDVFPLKNKLEPYEKLENEGC
jgi:hypothetical protein